MYKSSVLFSTVVILSFISSPVLSDSTQINVTEAGTGAVTPVGAAMVTTAPSSPYVVLYIQSITLQASFLPFGTMNYNRECF